MAGPGLRERKKQATRARITDAALALFADRGFEQVTVAEIAVAAEVSPATVFNYFPAKENLIYDGMASYRTALLAALHGRPAGTTVVAAFRDHVLQPRGVLADPTPGAVAGVARVARIVVDSPTLQARERLETDREVDALRALLAEELGDDGLLPWAVAAALVATTRGVSRRIRSAAVEGRLDARFTRRLLAEAAAAIAVVEAGL